MTTATEERQLGFWMCTALVIGNTIGMGIFILPASLAPYGFNASIGWVITVAGCLLIALVFARLARMMPRANGPYDYIRHELGELPAFMAMWCYWVSLWITNAAIATGVVGYLRELLPGLKALPATGIALVLLWIFVAINLTGTRSGGRLQIITTLLKLLPMLAVILLGGWLLGTTPAVYSAHPPANPISFSQILPASTIALFAMLGVESAAVPAARVRDAERIIPRATLAGTVIVALVYLLISTVPMLLIPQTTLAQSSAPFALLLDRFMGEGNGRWLSIFIVVSGLGALNGWTLLVGELTRSMALRGALPRSWSVLNNQAAPGRALLLTGVLASGMIWLTYSESLVAGFTFITSVVTAANLPLYLCCSAALYLQWRRGHVGEFRDLGWISYLGMAYVIFAFYGLGREPFFLGLLLAAAGLPLYGWMRLQRRPPTPTL
ncbi:MAG: Arginine/agmatine antiporter [Alphaproteobacteria bacterium ADurb.BinA280]|jgi:APA family basic amino acid/polyamine antiporter|nr:amino acid permease [Xanthomonadales bacterium]MCC6506047.1 amino acid permease [Aquimonas sp.]OPZ13081.1 MAG: Arginine/agmatine antiporter [Alphaproteobacteria bacterium ADurb.BinA280]